MPFKSLNQEENILCKRTNHIVSYATVLMALNISKPHMGGADKQKQFLFIMIFKERSSLIGETGYCNDEKSSKIV